MKRSSNTSSAPPTIPSGEDIVFSELTENTVPKADADGKQVDSQITDDGENVYLTGVGTSGNTEIRASAKRFYAITDGGNQMDVDFDDEGNALTLLINDPQVGISISGGTDTVQVLGSVFEIVTPSVFMFDLPTSDPHVAGQLYNLSGVLMISAG